MFHALNLRTLTFRESDQDFRHLILPAHPEASQLKERIFVSILKQVLTPIVEIWHLEALHLLSLSESGKGPVLLLPYILSAKVTLEHKTFLVSKSSQTPTGAESDLSSSDLSCIKKKIPVFSGEEKFDELLWDQSKICLEIEKRTSP